MRSIDEMLTLVAARRLRPKAVVNSAADNSIVDLIDLLGSLVVAGVDVRVRLQRLDDCLGEERKERQVDAFALDEAGLGAGPQGDDRSTSTSRSVPPGVGTAISTPTRLVSSEPRRRRSRGWRVCDANSIDRRVRGTRIDRQCLVGPHPERRGRSQ